MNVLIIGKDSYIGNNIQAHLEQYGHHVLQVDAITDAWKDADYAAFDTVVHVAAIVHNAAKTASAELFDRVNTQLPLQIASLARAAGVRQFILLSTMAVFGAEKSLSKTASVVTAAAPLAPVTLYGRTKLAAEEQLAAMATDSFTVSVVRPPNVYGPGCRGNYMYLLKKLARFLPLCPRCYTDVRQSMLYIENLSELIRLIAESRVGGNFMPQDDLAPNTMELITKIRQIMGKKTFPSRLLGLGVRLFCWVPLVKKIYGGVCYEEGLSQAFDGQYRIVSFDEGLRRTYQTT